MRWLGRALVLVLLLAAAPAGAQDDAELAAWRQRLDAAELEVTQAQQSAAAANAAYVSMRHDPSVRGDEKAKILAARGDTQRALTAAKARLAEVRDEARRAGAPPEWVLPNPSDAPADDL